MLRNVMLKWVIILLTLSIILFSAIFLVQFDIKGTDQSKKDETLEEIIHGKNIGQTFVINHYDLARIDVLFHTYNRTNTKDIIFHLRDSPEAIEDKAYITLNAQSILNDQYCTFYFNPLHDSKNRSYYFFIESPDSSNGDAVTIWHSTLNGHPEKTTYENHKPIGGDLCFKIYYKMTLAELFPYFMERFTQDQLFYYFYIVILMLIVTVIIIMQLKLHAIQSKTYRSISNVFYILENENLANYP